jgi:plasmid maintenance system antidote protein VapI
MPTFLHKIKINPDELELLSKPADTIKETVEMYNTSPQWQAMFFETMGYTSLEQYLDLLNGNIRITKEIAEKLEKALKVDAAFWMNRQRNYEEKLSRLAYPYKYECRSSCSGYSEMQYTDILKEKRKSFIEGMYFAYQYK